MRLDSAPGLERIVRTDEGTMYKRITFENDVYDIICTAHRETGHAGYRKTYARV